MLRGDVAYRERLDKVAEELKRNAEAATIGPAEKKRFFL
jgi:hypothetical protein